ncbi:hypothetical protein D3C76_1474130 [compost metagenome]
MAAHLTVIQRQVQRGRRRGVQLRMAPGEFRGRIPGPGEVIDMCRCEVLSPVGQAFLDERNMKSMIHGRGKLGHDVHPDHCG